MTQAPTPTCPSPTAPAASPAEVHLRYLDYFRAILVAKLEGLPEVELRSSRLPSRWTPLELVKHVTHVEARWLGGFEGREIGDPCGDQRDGRWHVPPTTPWPTSSAHSRTKPPAAAPSSKHIA
jgi:hypothetical protein